MYVEYWQERCCWNERACISMILASSISNGITRLFLWLGTLHKLMANLPSVVMNQNYSQENNLRVSVVVDG